jgi:hypothetical protein
VPKGRLEPFRLKQGGAEDGVAKVVPLLDVAPFARVHAMLIGLLVVVVILIIIIFTIITIVIIIVITVVTVTVAAVIVMNPTTINTTDTNKIARPSI